MTTPSNSRYTAQALYLPALGIVNCLGAGKPAIWDAVNRQDQSGISVRSDLMVAGDCYVGEVVGELPAIPEALKPHASRNNQLLMAATEEIVPEIEQLISRYGAERIAVVMGTSTSGIAETEQALVAQLNQGDFPPAYHYRQQEMAAPAEFLAQWLGLGNLAYTVSTACSSSAKVFASASHLIRSGVCDAAIVGGVDSLCRLTLNGFNALESVSPEICRPFSKNRNGITIGEAAAVFIVSPEPAAIELVAVGESSDAHHMSAPHPEGIGAEAAMKGALDNAGLQPEDISYINLHGTATVKNDQMESLAVHRLFGDDTPCSSTKGLTGHTLGAAGAIEIGLCWLALSQDNRPNTLPQHCWDGCVDDSLPSINLVTEVVDFQPDSSVYMMSNSFAFGGNNVSVIIGRPVGDD